MKDLKDLFIGMIIKQKQNQDNPVNNIDNKVLRDSQRNYFLPRVNKLITIDGRNFHDQPMINLKSKQ